MRVDSPHERPQISSPCRIPPPSEYDFKVQQQRFRNLEDASLRKTIYTLLTHEERGQRALVHYARGMYSFVLSIGKIPVFLPQGESSIDEQRMIDENAETATPDMQETLQANKDGKIVLYSGAYTLPGFDEAAHIMYFAPARKVNRVWHPCRLPDDMRYATFLVRFSPFSSLSHANVFSIGRQSRMACCQRQGRVRPLGHWWWWQHVL